jgi:hypothetical protein
MPTRTGTRRRLTYRLTSPTRIIEIGTDVGRHLARVLGAVAFEELDDFAPEIGPVHAELQGVARSERRPDLGEEISQEAERRLVVVDEGACPERQAL